MIKVCKRTVDEFNKYGYRTIHLFKDYYLVRNRPNNEEVQEITNLIIEIM